MFKKKKATHGFTSHQYIHGWVYNYHVQEGIWHSVRVPEALTIMSQFPQCKKCVSSLKKYTRTGTKGKVIILVYTCIYRHIFVRITFLSNQIVSGTPWPASVQLLRIFISNTWLPKYITSHACRPAAFPEQHMYSYLKRHERSTYHTGTEAKNISAFCQGRGEGPTQIQSETQKGEEFRKDKQHQWLVILHKADKREFWNVSIHEACVCHPLIVLYVTLDKSMLSRLMLKTDM